MLGAKLQLPPPNVTMRIAELEIDPIQLGAHAEVGALHDGARTCHHGWPRLSFLTQPKETIMIQVDGTSLAIARSGPL
jgi:hypothetical protein